jgi:hypothetical protein
MLNAKESQGKHERTALCKTVAIRFAEVGKLDCVALEDHGLRFLLDVDSILFEGGLKEQDAQVGRILALLRLFERERFERVVQWELDGRKK